MDVPPATQTHPLFDRSSADCTLQSPDGTLFRVHRVLITQASRWWKDYFAKAGKHQQIVLVTEDAFTLAALLCLVYPMPDPELATVEVAIPLLCAAEKYEMEEALQLLHVRLSSLIASHPGRAFSLAWHHRSSSAVRLIARHIVRDCPPPGIAPSAPASAQACFEAYRAACISAAASLTACSPPWIPFVSCTQIMARETSRTRFSNIGAWWCRSCLTARKVAFIGVKPVAVSAWFAEYMDAAAVALSKWPSAEALRAAEVTQGPWTLLMQCKQRPSGCSSTLGQSDFAMFAEYFALKIERKVDEVWSRTTNDTLGS
jgi:hypothetical protein